MEFLRSLESVIPGVQGRVLAVLVETTAELNMRTIARLAGVSVAQVSRVLPHLVELGVVERRDVPPSSLFRLVPEHVSVGPLLALARPRDTVIEEMGRIADELPVAPASIILFGSFARGEADVLSDIDAVVVRPSDVEASDEGWQEAVEQWRSTVSRLSGSPVEILEVGAEEVAARLRSGRQIWRDIRRDGVVVYGFSLHKLGEHAAA